MPQGEIIRKYRLAKGWNQEKLSEEVGVSYQSISNWENNKTDIDTDHLVLLAQKLGISTDLLTGQREDKEDYAWKLRERFYNDDKMRTFLKGYLNAKNYQQSMMALDFAKAKHDATGATRKVRNKNVKIPYINHPFTLACHAIAMKVDCDDLITALLLHDVCEDCNVKVDELPNVSDTVREVVRLVTKTKHYDYDKYYAEIMKNPMACMVKCIDRCNNVSMMAMGFSKAKIDEYIRETEEKIYPMFGVLKATPEYNNAYWLLSYQIYACIESAKNFLKNFE